MDNLIDAISSREILNLTKTLFLNTLFEIKFPTKSEGWVSRVVHGRCWKWYPCCWPHRLIEISLRERGFEVFNLGVNTPTWGGVYRRCNWAQIANVLLISSLNGEAEGWSRDLPILKGKFDLDSVLFVIGGNLM